MQDTSNVKDVLTRTSICLQHDVDRPQKDECPSRHLSSCQRTVSSWQALFRGFHMNFSQQADFQTQVMQYEDPLEMSP